MAIRTSRQILCTSHEVLRPREAKDDRQGAGGSRQPSRGAFKGEASDQGGSIYVRANADGRNCDDVFGTSGMKHIGTLYGHGLFLDTNDQDKADLAVRWMEDIEKRARKFDEIETEREVKEFFKASERKKSLN